jgi:hypothetical protein
MAFILYTYLQYTNINQRQHSDELASSMIKKAHNQIIEDNFKTATNVQFCPLLAYYVGNIRYGISNARIRLAD